MYKVFVIPLAVLIDLIFGDPPNRLHPLILMGRFLSFGKRLFFFNSNLATRSYFWAGTFWTLAGIILFTLPFKLLKNKKVKKYPTDSTKHTLSFPLHHSSLILHPLLLTLIFAYKGLREAVKKITVALNNNNLIEARRLLSWHLVSRDTSQLDATEIAGATIESLAENITDSVTAPLLAYAIGGLPTAWAYRFVNTADAMWGYRTPEFEQLGKFPAKLDDALNWLPARLTGWLLVLAAYLSPRANGRNAARIMLTQHHRTASPNAGWTMATMAGALEITLTKRDVYELAGGQKDINTDAIKQALRLTDICVALSIVLICSGLILGAIAKPHFKRKND